MSDQIEKIISKFQTMLRQELSMQEFWQEFDLSMEQDVRSIDDLTAEIPETLSSDEEFEELRALALQTLELCRKKKELLKKLESELKDFDGI